jgi:tetratricopeptide (TPR) repeat protein
VARANPESFFEVAARHLFRHINDVDALRGNPLVRSFFACAGRDGGDTIVLPRIHARILMEAAALRKERATLWSKEHVRRQHAIVVALCGGEHAEDTAARLGLSRRHYYRERHIICMRVARALFETNPKRAIGFEVGDRLRLLFARAAVLLDQGLARKAMSLLEEARSGLPEGTVRSAVRLELARVMISLGDASRAAELLAESGGLTDDRQAGDVTSAWLCDHQALTEALLAMETGRDAAAGRTLEALAKRRIADKRPDETALDTLVKCGFWYCGFGRFSQARTMLLHARELNRRLLRSTVPQQIAIALLAAQCAEDSVDEFNSQHHWLTEALALSISNGSVEGALGAISSLIFYYVSIGSDGDAYALAEEGLGIARGTEGTRLLETVAVQIVVMLLRTRFWRAVNPLLFEVEKFTEPGCFSWGLLKQAQGTFQGRTGQYDCAQVSLAKAYEVARNVNNRKLEGVVLRERAVVLHRVGSLSESIEFMRQAVELAEEHRSAYTLWATYDAAARVLPDRRFARLAQHARAAVLARANTFRSTTSSDSGSQSTHTNFANRANGVRPRLTIAGQPLNEKLAHFVPCSLDFPPTEDAANP